MNDQGTLTPNTKVQPEEVKKEKEVTKCFWVVEIVFVILALGLYVGIYFINLIASAEGILSPYYSTGSAVMNQLVVGASSVPQPTFTVSNIIKTISFNWIMWKAANVIVLLDMLAPLTWRRKLVGMSVFSVIMCALDWCTFVLLHDHNYDYAFIGISWIVTLLISITLFANQ